MSKHELMVNSVFPTKETTVLSHRCILFYDNSKDAREIVTQGNSLKMKDARLVQGFQKRRSFPQLEKYFSSIQL